jgi:hypothetical protein
MMDGDPKSVVGHHLRVGPAHEHAGGRVHLGGGARQHGLGPAGALSGATAAAGQQDVPADVI